MRAEAGDIIVNKIWARNGSVAVVPESLSGTYGSGEFPMFAPNRTRLNPAWMHWLTKTKSFWEQCDEKSRGTSGKNRIRPEQFLGVEIPLPPLSEQRRIVARIEELAAKVAAARNLRREAAAEGEGLPKAELNALAQKLTGDHESLLLGEVTTFVGDMNHEMPSATEEGMAFVSPKDFVPDGTIDYVHAKRISHADFERLSKKCRPCHNDILMARYGTVGEARVVATNEPFLASYSIAVIRPDQSRIATSFLHWMVCSQSVQQQVNDGIRGGIQADLGLKTIRQLQIPVPPLSKQRQVVAELDALQAKVNELKKLQAETQAELDALLPSILDRAFKGEL